MNKDFEKFYEIDTDPRDGQLTIDQFKTLVKDSYTMIPQKAVTEVFDYSKTLLDDNPELSYDEYGLAMKQLNIMKKDADKCTKK